MHFRIKSRLIAVVVVVCLTFVYANCLQAKPNNPNSPKVNTPVIEKVVVDFDYMEILIFGQYLRGDIDPEIFLSGLPIVLSDSDTGAVEEVIAVLPEWYGDGGHLLVLMTESGASSFDLTIGAVGPEGDQGIQGIQGPKGDKGDQGIQGLKGDKGDQGIQGIQGPKGDKGDTGPQGVPGPKGDKGDTGDQGPSVLALEDISTVDTQINANNDTILNMDAELSEIKAKLAGIEESLEADMAILSNALAEPTKADFGEIEFIGQKNIAVSDELEALYATINKEGGFASGLTTLSSQLSSVQQQLSAAVDNATTDNLNLVTLSAISLASQAAQLTGYNVEFLLINQILVTAAQRLSGSLIMLAAVDRAMDLLVADRTFTAVGTAEDDYGFRVLGRMVRNLQIKPDEYIYIDVYQSGVNGAKLCSNDPKLRRALQHFASPWSDYYGGFNASQNPTTTWVKGTGGSWSPAKFLELNVDIETYQFTWSGNTYTLSKSSQISITATGENNWGFAGGLLDVDTSPDFPENPVDVTGYYTNDVSQPLNFTIRVGTSKLLVCGFM
jgi:hypothetical protein